jgi:hypothetical protein
VQELRVQTVGEQHYFHVRLDIPADLVLENDGWWTGPSPSPELAPRLVAADGGLQVVCQRFERDRNRRDPIPDPEVFKDKDKDGPPIRDKVGKDAPRMPRQPVPVRGLEFIGRYDPKAGEVKAKLLYPVPGRPLPIIGRLTKTPPPPVWREMDVVLDLKKATVVQIPKEAAERAIEKPKKNEDMRFWRQPPVRDDLEGLWAVAQIEQFMDLDHQVSEFGFYSFAGTAIARKYGVRAPREDWRWNVGFNRGGTIFDDRRLFEMTTGATAIAETLQLRRLTTPPSPAEKRTIDVAKIQGIDVAEHPWKEMMGDKKPADEPLAKMIPHDNYYIAFHDPMKLLEFAGLLQAWGGNITSAMNAPSRDYRLWQRYEQQLCLNSAALGKNLASLGIKGVGITGNDAYLRDGTDITLLLTASDPKGLITALEPMLGEARKKFGARLKETKTDHNGVEVESFVTPLREVSLYRVVLGDVLILSNSPAGLKRVVDAAKGKSKRLADALDFQYMRVVFRADDKGEDGFAYLPDAFIRNFVGPASRIKQKRRLEALTSLHMLTHGALLTAWESGKTPTSTPNLLTAAGLRGEEVPVPDGKPATWDTEQLAAVSEVYGTIHFGTPLVELDVDLVTPGEAEMYRRFRLEYLGLWRQYFDPIGMRLAMREGQVKLETYILPLIENSAYNNLRAITGKGTVQLTPSSISSKTLLQYMMHLSTDANERGGWFGLGRGPNGPLAEATGIAGLMAWAVDPLGEWFLVRLDDSPNYEKLVRMAERGASGDPVDIEEVAKLVWTLPVAIGVDIKNPLSLTAGLTALRTSAMMSLPGALTWGPLEKDYKGVQIVRVQATPAGRRMLGPLGPGGPPRREAFLPAIYYAMLDGALYVSLNEEMMRGLIDTAEAKKEGKVETVEINTSLYLSPAAAQDTKTVLKRLLEVATNSQARTALPIWYALYRTGIVAPDAKPDAAADAAYRYLAFVPVSPDGTGYRYDRATDEVVNERHGSYRKPVLEKTTAETSPVARLLESLQSVRADLRFREDGIQTTLTLDRRKPGR